MAGVVTVSIQSEASEFPTEKRYDPSIKILDLKKKLELITGADYTSMKITLYKDDLEVVLDKDDESLTHYLGDYANKALKLVVKGEQPQIQDEDTPKFVISEDKYLERPDNARNFIKEKRMSNQKP